jgi:bacteriorhodopsin
VKSSRTIFLRIFAILVASIAIHRVEQFARWYFFAIAVAAGLIALRELGFLRQFRFHSKSNQSNRLAVWIVLVCLSVIGWLHNANSWTHDGLFVRPANIALWKTELILVIALAGPLLHWLASAAAPRLRPMDGQKFALEFALYVNFSGIALVRWTGDAAVSTSTVSAVLALSVLAELTLKASTPSS